MIVDTAFPSECLPFDLKAILASAKLSALSHEDDCDNWSKVANVVDYLPVAYSRAMIDYQLSYWQGNGRNIKDLSFVLYWDKQPCAIWPLSLALGEENPLGSNGDCILPPIFVSGFSLNSQKKLLTACLDFIDYLSLYLKAKYWIGTESYSNKLGISEWHQRALCRGAVSSLSYELFIDLEPSLAEIKLGFRKSYKPLINAGVKQWQINILSEQNESVWSEFKALHLEVAGKKTRSDESWQLQHAAMSIKQAFLVYLRDDENRMVGGGFFHITRNEGVYAVGAYDRSLFDKPLGHVVQYRAVEEMKARGLRWYKIGARPYPADKPSPTEKELSIAEFKQGFASHLFPCFRLHCEI